MASARVGRSSMNPVTFCRVVLYIWLLMVFVALSLASEYEIYPVKKVVYWILCYFVSTVVGIDLTHNYSIILRKESDVWVIIGEYAAAPLLVISGLYVQLFLHKDVQEDSKPKSIDAQIRHKYLVICFLSKYSYKELRRR